MATIDHPIPTTVLVFYDFSTPSAETLAAYGCTTDTYGEDLLQWHGIKHDLTAGTKQAKFVFHQNHGTYLTNLPTQLPPNRTAFYARIHNTDGSVSQWVDTYVISTNNYMREWCADIGKPFLCLTALQTSRGALGLCMTMRMER